MTWIRKVIHVSEGPLGVRGALVAAARNRALWQLWFLCRLGTNSGGLPAKLVVDLLTSEVETES